MIINGREKTIERNSDLIAVVLEQPSFSHVARLLAGRWDDFNSDYFFR
jgi:hypothetical protein